MTVERLDFLGISTLLSFAMSLIVGLVLGWAVMQRCLFR
jgi:hypothetical protein